MKKVSIQELRSNLKAILDDLPVQVTRKGLAIAIIQRAEDIVVQEAPVVQKKTRSVVQQKKRPVQKGHIDFFNKTEPTYRHKG